MNGELKTYLVMFSFRRPKDREEEAGIDRGPGDERYRISLIQTHLAGVHYATPVNSKYYLLFAS